ncbi:MAG: SDR family NAD(P)-dependent oxidoreductase [Novosphingobium sp.]
MSEQRVVVVTGASSGIGKATAEAFAGMGWHVIGTGRNPERSAAAEKDIRAAASPDARVDFLRGDLALMSETMRIANEIKGLTSRVDVLINNAGGVRDKRYVTKEGTEETFTANHLAPFLLTRELMPLLKTAAAASEPGAVRVLAVASMAYLSAESMNWDDLQNLNGDFPASGVYCQAKLANMLFTHGLSQRLEDSGIVTHALVPGVVHTNFASHGDEAMQSFLQDAPGKTAEDVAGMLVSMATAPEFGTNGGRGFYDFEEHAIAPHGADDQAAARLWTESEKILEGLGY